MCPIPGRTGQRWTRSSVLCVLGHVWLSLGLAMPASWPSSPSQFSGSFRAAKSWPFPVANPGPGRSRPTAFTAPKWRPGRWQDHAPWEAGPEFRPERWIPEPNLKSAAWRAHAEAESWWRRRSGGGAPSGGLACRGRPKASSVRALGPPS